MGPHLIHALANVESLEAASRRYQIRTDLTLSPAGNYSAETSRAQNPRGAFWRLTLRAFQAVGGRKGANR
jgi:hypothetical protein